jgi:hypothetical protein
VLFGDLRQGSIHRVKEDGTGLQEVIPAKALIPFSVSPDGQWVVVQDPVAFGALVLYPTSGGSPLRLCERCSRPQGVDWIPPPLSWSPDGKFVYLKFGESTFAIPLPAGRMLPAAPPKGFPDKAAVAALSGAKLISEEPIYPGPNPSIYAFVKVTTQRNIYRVPVP